MPRERDPRGQGKGGERVGNGLGGGPVGSSNGYSGRPTENGNSDNPNNPNNSENNRQNDGNVHSNDQQPSRQTPTRGMRNMGRAVKTASSRPVNGGRGNYNNNNNNNRRGGLTLGKMIRIAVIVVLVIWLFRACSNMNAGSDEQTTDNSSYTNITSVTPTPQPAVSEPAAQETTTSQPAAQQTASSSMGISAQSSYTAPCGVTDINAATTSTGWTGGSNVGNLSTAVSDGVRSKFYQPAKNGTVNLMIYMIGTDLESQYNMGTSDLQEIVNATENMPSNVNLIVYGGGCKSWHNNKFSNTTNYVYQITSGGKFKMLYDDGNKIMTDKSTLASFLQYVNKNYQTSNASDRNILILWDHGGGSVTGYGYDERHKGAGSMVIGDVAEAIESSNMKFDFVGFDACLMATAETATSLTKVADYLVASEESEPGIGWYYTNWLKTLFADTTVSTLDLGKEIVDDFVNTCAKQCQGQDTTLSVTDLAEFDALMPKALDDFSTSTIEMIESDYNTVARARGASKEFASDSQIDQVDLASLAAKLGTDEGNELVKTIKSVVKYNKTSYTVTDAYGLSIYFPYRSLTYLSDAVSTCSDVGLTDNYSKCIQSFASVASSSQSYSTGWGSPYGSLSGYSGSSSSYSYGSEEMLAELLSQMLFGRNIPMDVNKTAKYIAENQLDTSLLKWTKNSNGVNTITLPKEQWQLITEVEQNLFYDDGKGYIDYGLDITSDCFTEDGQLVGDYQGYWISIDGWMCAYYRINEVVDENGETTITGRVPCYFNGTRANLIVQHVGNKGSIIGVSYNYIEDGSNVSAKVIPVSNQGTTDNISSEFETDIQSAEGFNKDDKIILIADCYDYNNNYQDNYAISEELTWGDGLEVYDVSVPDMSKVSATYKITDIYNKTYWTPVME